MKPTLEYTQKALIRSIEANPRDLRGYLALADAYKRDGEARKAELTLLRVIEIDPFHHRAWVDLGALYSRQQNWRCSIDAFERACTLDTQDPESWLGHAWALLAIQDIREATKVRDLLMARFPDRPESHLIAGHLYKIRGRSDAAEAAYRRVLQLNPRQTDAIYNLVDLAPPSPVHPFTKSLERLRAEPSLSPRESANVCFSLARIYEKSEQVEKAMELLHEANAAANSAMLSLGIVYDPQKVEQETTQKISMFGPSAFSHALEPLSLDLRMSFIVGMPRSGTTLVERILCSHSLVTTGGELPFMQDCLSKLHMHRQSEGKQGSIDPEDEEDAQFLLQLREAYLDNLFERDLDGEYVIDKLPANFAAVGLIRILFPDALIIHCSRSPVATCWSLYSAHFGIHLPYYVNLEHLVHYYKNVYTRWMNHWSNVIEANIINVAYEELVMNPESEIRSLIRRCGLPWQDDCLSFYHNEQPIFTASMQQARKPIYSTSVRRWRKFEKYLAPITAGLPYETL